MEGGSGAGGRSEGEEGSIVRGSRQGEGRGGKREAETGEGCEKESGDEQGGVGRGQACQKCQ